MRTRPPRTYTHNLRLLVALTAVPLMAKPNRTLEPYIRSGTPLACLVSDASFAATSHPLDGDKPPVSQSPIHLIPAEHVGPSAMT